MNENYKGSPFINIGPQVQKEHFEKNIENWDPNETKYRQFQSNGLEYYSPFSDINETRKYYENRYDHLFITNEGYKIVIKQYIDSTRVLIEFIHSGVMRWVHKKDIFVGDIKYPYHPNKYGGFFGEGPYNRKDYKKLHNTWNDMLDRAANNDIHRTTEFRYYNWYKNCSVCMEWYNYQYFAAWMDSKLKQLNPSYDYHLDKDLHQWNYEYKIYGPNTCTLLPADLNKSLSALNYMDCKISGLPKGVIKHGNKFATSITAMRVKKFLGDYNTPEEAFEIFKYNKEKTIKEQAINYYNDGALFKEDLDIIMRIDIQPYSNPLLKSV